MCEIKPLQELLQQKSALTYLAWIGRFDPKAAFMEISLRQSNSQKLLMLR